MYLAVILANDNDPFTFPEKYHLIGNGMTMKAVLLAWLETIDGVVAFNECTDAPLY